MSEMPLAYECDKRKARKAHKCCECSGVIQPGETYNYHHGVWPDGPGEYNVCLECDELRAKADKELRYYEDKTAFTMLYESVFESRDFALIHEYLNVCRKRGATIPQWQLNKETSLNTISGSK